MTARRDGTRPLRVRWLGQLGYEEAWDLQRGLFAGGDDHLLLCTHPPVYTLGVRADEANLLVDPTTVGAGVHRVDRGGDVTFHGPGQLVGYPVLSVPGKRGGGMADTVAYVTSIERLLIDVLAELDLDAGRVAGSPGVWLDPGGERQRKIAAVGVKLSRGRSMHGFALNVDVDLGWFGHIVPCGIADKAVTSLRAEGIDVGMQRVVDLVAERAGRHLEPVRPIERQDVAWRVRSDDLSPFTRGVARSAGARPADGGGVPVRLRGRLADAGVGAGMEVGERKPPWMRVKLRTDPGYRRLKAVSRRLDLVTVCEEAGCPNIFECWNEGTATFMVLGDRCTRACGFCLVDTRRPLPPDGAEPGRVADAVVELGLSHAVLTMVARDDLDDGGAAHVAATVEAVRLRAPDATVEVLISDLGGSAEALTVVLGSRPDVVNHNIETVARLQRAVRPSAAYGRSLALLARAGLAGATTKSGIIVGLGEERSEVEATLADLAAVGVGIVTVGQYLRPTADHLPVQRWWTPDEFDDLKAFGESELGIPHVEASPLTRSSHHAGSALEAITGQPTRTRSWPPPATARG
ncbi:MAG: lipoyl synthase [Acidimicrobiales bacterium]